MSSYVVRSGRQGDAAEVAKVHASTRIGAAEGLPEETIQENIRVRCSVERWESILMDPTFDYDRFFVAENKENDEIIGFVHPVTNPDLSPTQIEINRLFVALLHQGNGVGRALMQRIAEACKADGFTSLFLWSAPTPATRRFYENNGFVFTGESKQYELVPGLMRTNYAYVHQL